MSIQDLIAPLLQNLPASNSSDVNQYASQAEQLLKTFRNELEAMQRAGCTNDTFSRARSIANSLPVRLGLKALKCDPNEFVACIDRLERMFLGGNSSPTRSVSSAQSAQTDEIARLQALARKLK